MMALAESSSRRKSRSMTPSTLQREEDMLRKAQETSDFSGAMHLAGHARKCKCNAFVEEAATGLHKLR